MTAPPIPPEWADPPDFTVARAAQLGLAARVVREDRLGPVRRIAGVDISGSRFDPEKRIFAAVVVLDWPSLTVVAEAVAVQRARIPYVPGYLGFREVPALREAWAALPVQPDLVLVDGHGLAHPRGFGIASHLGVVLDVPTIGVGKSILVGQPEGGALVWKGARLGTVLPTRTGANPLYISAGHRVTEATAVAWVRACLRGYRLPEPTRLAHRAAGAARRAAPLSPA